MRARALVSEVGCVLACQLLACSRHDSGKGVVPGPADAWPAPEGRSERGADDEARFSRPIAATRLGDGSTVVAGLVVAKSAIVAMRVAPDGKTAWSKVVLDGVAWTGGADLRALPAPDGAAIVWRGQRAGKTVTQMARLGAGGELRGPGVDVGPAACATDEALAWLEHGASGTTRVRALPWSAAVAADVLTMAADRDPELVCGAHRLFALAGGEDDVTVAIASGLEAGSPAQILRDRDFGSDEEREHDAYTVGDALGIVRMGDSGALAIREVGARAGGAWRTLTTRISPDDDIVAVDADARTVVVVFTHEQSEGCDGASALSVRAVRASRLPGEGGVAEESIELAPPACDRDPGPFWTGALDRSFVVAWGERGHGTSARNLEAGSVAPVSGLAYRTLDQAPGPPQSRLQHVELAADELVSAGCDRAHCYAAALVRPPGGDGMQPESIRVIAYP